MTIRASLTLFLLALLIFLFNSDILRSILLVGGGVGSNLSITESKTFSNLEIDSSVLTNSLFNFLIHFLRWDLNFCAPSILFIMESLSDLNLSSSLLEDLICLFNLFALFLLLFICLAVDCFSSSSCIFGRGGGGGLVGFGGLVRGAGGGGVACAVSKAINSAFLNLECLLILALLLELLVLVLSCSPFYICKKKREKKREGKKCYL